MSVMRARAAVVLSTRCVADSPVIIFIRIIRHYFVHPCSFIVSCIFFGIRPMLRAHVYLLPVYCPQN
eukprot:COSAG02_NODE_1377_length_12993_cov_5.210718_7_plen_67_part_00